MSLDVDRRRSVPRIVGTIASMVACALLAIAPANAGATAGSSAGVLLRRARYALAEGRPQAATEALRAARLAEPRSPRGLEAALLLADVQLRSGDADAADRTLGDAERDFPDGDEGAQLVAARGWIGLARGDAASALRHFERVATRTDDTASREMAMLGTAWARLTTVPAQPGVPSELVTLAASAQDPIARAGALLSLARAYGARGEHRRALRALRRLQRLVRHTTLSDDVALSIGLVQLDMGRPLSARRTLAPIAAGGAGAEAAPAGKAEGLTLADLRLPPTSFAARLATLHAGQTQPGIDLRHFLGTLVDRSAQHDAATALGVAEAAIAAGKGV